MTDDQPFVDLSMYKTHVDTSAMPTGGISASERADQRRHFLSRHGYDHEQMTHLGGDADYRQYYRLPAKNDQVADTVLLMDVPPGLELAHYFVKIADHLEKCDVWVPERFEFDPELGFLMVEDLGDRHLGHILRSGENAMPYLKKSIDLLVTLHSHPESGKIELSDQYGDILIDEACWLTDWYWPHLHNGDKIDPDLRDQFRQIWKDIFHSLPRPEYTLIMRDFLADNIMVTADDQVAAIDFQPALRGSRAFDLFSLLNMVRYDISDAMRDDLKTYYHEQMGDNPADIAEFDRWYHVHGARRLTKIFGNFVRLNVRDDKPGYMKYLPRTKELLNRTLRASDDLAPIYDWYQRHLPELIDDDE
jgi:aminoglycoside/choline kinase family phosphotransferase